MLKRASVHKLHTDLGFSLLEIMVAIAVATIALTSLVVISNTAVRGVDTARGRTTADQYVREGIEQMRAYRDNPAIGFAGLTTGLVANTPKYYSLNTSGVPQPQTHIVASNPCSVATASASGTTYQITGHTTYYRIITQRLEGAQDRVTVTVCFSVKNGTSQSASAQTLLTNWR